MCLSKVYLNRKQENNLVIKEVSRIKVNGERIHIDTLIGEGKDFPFYVVSEINFLENYVILKSKKNTT